MIDMSAYANTVSVIVPTYHRPEMLRAAMASVLAQDLPAGITLEVVIALSDPSNAADREAADEVARADARVVVASSLGTGPGAARNAALNIARGQYIAFTDDDCEAQPGWIRAGVARLEEADLVQGRTAPARTTHRYEKSVSIEQLSWLWETCNIFVRRSAIDASGGFHENWNPLGRVAQPYGEDSEWGWRLVRQGATYAFEPDAVIHHAVFDHSFKEWADYQAQVRFFPFQVREIPELRRRLTHGYFLTRRHVFLTAAAGLLVGAGAARLIGRRGAAKGLAVSAAVPLLSPWRFQAYDAFRFTLKELIEFGSLVYGSIRYRRTVL